MGKSINSNSLMKTLDWSLVFLKKATENEPRALYEHLLSIFPQLAKRDARSIVDKLKFEKLIGSIFKKDDLLEYNFITFDGLLLLEQYGGYENRLKKLNSRDIHQIWLTRAIALGTVIAAVLYGYSLYLQSKELKLTEESIRLEQNKKLDQ